MSSHIRVLIADDEPLAREGIRQLLRHDSDVEIVGEAKDGIQATEMIEEMTPDLVFLDIQMPERDGFGVVEEVGPDNMPVVIFVTAFDEHALRAFEIHALDYLLKPLDPDRFAEALQRAKNQLKLKQSSTLSGKLLKLIESLPAPRPALQRIAVKVTGKVFFVNTYDIDWVQANGDYVVLHTQGKKHLVREKIGDLQQKLDPQQFVRIHRSSIVNIDRIKDLEPMFYGDYAVNMVDGTKLTLSRSYRDAAFARLNLKH
ncbi:MAG: response regulator transcription factor [Ignavibacteriae bacterium]|nr:response regulator transcription factor [Ignavibacteriota bacterium]